MALIRADDKNNIEVQSSDKVDTYWLRTMIGGWARDRIEASRVKLQMSQSKLGKNDPNAVFDLLMDKPTYNTVLKMTYIVKWTYKENGAMLPLTQENLRDMSPEDDDIVLAAIKEIHEKQFGVKAIDPLDVPSEA